MEEICLYQVLNLTLVMKQKCIRSTAMGLQGVLVGEYSTALNVL